MSEHFTIDLVTEDEINNEFVLYLVEEGSCLLNAEIDLLKKIRDRLFCAFDVIVDGQLASRFPDSKSKNIRIQVDYHDEKIPEIESLVKNFNEFIHSNTDYQKSIQQSAFVSSIRVVTRAQMGRR